METSYRRKKKKKQKSHNKRAFTVIDIILEIQLNTTGVLLICEIYYFCVGVASLKPLISSVMMLISAYPVCI